VLLARRNPTAPRLLSARPEHAAAVEQLPDHHRDPFDRLLVAQTEPLRLLSRDPRVIRYGATVLAG
jgi:PIN domain nuclease of toxin-antitoxin system